MLKESLIAGMALMFLGTLCFEFLPVQMLSTFSKDAQVIAIGTNGFKFYRSQQARSAADRSAALLHLFRTERSCPEVLPD